MVEIIEGVSEKDVLTIYGDIFPGVDIRVRIAVEALNSKKGTLLVILHTNGGIVEEVRNIVQIIRHHYDTVHFLIPICAMSAGTVLVMSGDKIYMDYFSRLGPIDPQIQNQNGDFVPALSYLRQYKRLIKKGNLTNAEFVLLDKLDLAQLHKIELAANLDWLTQYKFKDWYKNGESVPEEYKQKRAKEIAESLNDHEKWYTHGNSLHKDILDNDLRLKIDDYGENEDLKKAVWEYFWALQEYAGRNSFVQSRGFI